MSKTKWITWQPASKMFLVQQLKPNLKLQRNRQKWGHQNVITGKCIAATQIDKKW